jgi:hypothetical protein
VSDQLTAPRTAAGRALLTPCEPWTGSVDSEGYGRTRGRRAHRVVYEREVGQIPEGFTIDHLCRNRRCVNPAHMEPVPNGVNVLRGYGPPAQNARKTHCAHGHPLTGANLYIHPRGARVCRTCRRSSQMGWLRKRALLRREVGE